MSKRPSETAEDGPSGKVARLDAAVPGVVKHLGGWME